MDMIFAQNMVNSFSGYEMMENENGDAAEYRKQAPGSAVIRVSAENGEYQNPGRSCAKHFGRNVAETKSVDEEELFQIS